MNVSRYFLLIAIIYLLAGMGLGHYMGASDDSTLRPVHAHINLVGFTLMAVFAAIYEVFPAMVANRLAKYHFYLHQIGALSLIIVFYLLFGPSVEDVALIQFVIVADIGLFGGILMFGYNAVRNAR